MKFLILYSLFFICFLKLIDISLALSKSRKQLDYKYVSKFTNISKNDNDINQLLVSREKYIGMIKKKLIKSGKINETNFNESHFNKTFMVHTTNLSEIRNMKNRSKRVVNSYFPSIFEKELDRNIKIIITNPKMKNLTKIINNPKYRPGNPRKEIIICDHPQNLTLSQVFTAFLYKKMSPRLLYSLSELGIRVKFLCSNVAPIFKLMELQDNIKSRNLSYKDEKFYTLSLGYTLAITSDIFLCKLTHPKFKLVLFNYMERAKEILYPPKGKQIKKCEVMSKESIINLIQTLFNLLNDFQKKNNEQSNLQESTKMGRTFLMHLREFRRHCE